ncbi:MAG: hypothetical protein LWW85_09990 [Marinilabiliales bacterium]|nr:hypothetical protein [Marinilabiliales bacterium]
MKRLAVLLLLCFSFEMLMAQDALLLRDQGNKALASKQYALALAKYEKAFTVWGKRAADPAMIFSAGTSAYMVKDMKKSLKYIDQAIGAGYNLDMAYQYRACIMKANNDSAGYLKTLKEGWTKVPNSRALKETLAKHYVSLGDQLYRAGNEAARKVAEQMKSGKYSLSDKNFQSLNAKAKSALNEAIQWLNQGLELNPADEKAKTLKTSCENQLKNLI